MKADHDVKNLQDKGTRGAGSSAGAATTASDAPGIRYVYSEQEQHVLLGHLESLDERLSLLSEQIRAESGVNKDEIDDRLLAISGDLAALSKELQAIDVRDDLGRLPLPRTWSSSRSGTSICRWTVVELSFGGDQPAGRR
jgi:hypothetical protein